MKPLECILVTASIIVLTGCFKEEIPLNLNTQENRRLVVDAWITNGSDQQSITLSLTSNYLDKSKEEAVDDAQVKVLNMGEEIEFMPVGNGTYEAPEDWHGEVGQSYRLVIDHDDQIYTAESTIRPMPELDDIEVVNQSSVEGQDSFDIFFAFEDNPGPGDGYFGVDYVKGTIKEDWLDAGDWIDDAFLNGVKLVENTVTSTYFLPGQIAILEVHSIGKEAAVYFTNLDIERYREGLFEPTPVNVRSNIDNGAVGFFITSAVRKYEIAIE